MEQEPELAPFRICTYLALAFNCSPEVVIPIYLFSPPLSMRDMFSHFKFELVQRFRKHQQNPANERLIFRVTSHIIKTATSLTNFIDQPCCLLPYTEEGEQWELITNGPTSIKFQGLGTSALYVSVKPPGEPGTTFYFTPLERQGIPLDISERMLWITQFVSQLFSPKDFGMYDAFNRLLENTYF